MRFILSRTDDYANHAKKLIVGYALLFWLITRIISAIAVIACTAIYNHFGINPETLANFGATPGGLAGLGSVADIIIMVLVIAPLLEEGIFRLGLSFRKWQVALSLALIPLMAIWMKHASFHALQYALCLGASVAIFCSVYFLTAQRMWSRIKKRHLVAASWISSVAFGLCHLMAFGNVSLMLVPYCLCLISVIFFGGCACTYLRVNLGFGWGVAMHAFNNLPALAAMAALQS